MSSSAVKKRQRFSPEKRRAMILDVTADIVARDGVANLSMDLIAKEAGVSKSLVYNYFDNLTQMLRELLERELKAQRRLQAKAAERAETFEDLVRGVTHEYLKYIEERGLIIERLQSEPSISNIQDPTKYSRDGAVDILSELVAKHFGLPHDLARAATDISFGLPASAGEYLLRKDVSLQEIEDITVSMILGSITKLRDDYLTRRRRIPRD